MDTVDDLVEEVKARIAKSDFKAVVAFEITDSSQTITIDGNQRPPIIDNEALPKVTLKATFETFKGLLEGSVNPMVAIPTRKLKFEGSNGVAMHLLPVLKA